MPIPAAAAPTTPSAIPSALAARGFAVLVLDLAAGPRPDDGSAVERPDVVALRSAAEGLRDQFGDPALLIGHSEAGPSVLAAASSLSGVRAVVTIGSPAPGQVRLRTPLLVLHAPSDPVVPAREAERVFDAATRPRSFIALDGLDHVVADPDGGNYVAGLVDAWVRCYLPGLDPSTSDDQAGAVVVTEAGTGTYTQRITAGRHVLSADEPVAVGGADAGPNPYDLLLAALGACMSITLRMYADRKGLPLRRATVRLRHDRVHAEDCEQVEQKAGLLSRIRRGIELEGPLTEPERQRLIEIADRCPVHRTLSSEIAFETLEATDR
jgi:uncharacterized OsmC-like protein/dienelactone hydrolase